MSTPARLDSVTDPLTGDGDGRPLDPEGLLWRHFGRLPVYRLTNGLRALLQNMHPGLAFGGEPQPTYVAHYIAKTPLNLDITIAATTEAAGNSGAEVLDTATLSGDRALRGSVGRRLPAHPAYAVASA
jgi:hypothetical protein